MTMTPPQLARRYAVALSLAAAALSAHAHIIQDKRTDWLTPRWEEEPESITQYFTAVDRNIALLRVWTFHTGSIAGYPSVALLTGPGGLSEWRDAYPPPDTEYAWEGYMSFDFSGIQLVQGEQYAFQLYAIRGSSSYALNRNDGPYGDAYSGGYATWVGTANDPHFESDIAFQLIASPVPEPSSAMMAGLGLAGIAAWSRARRKRSGQ